MGQNAPDYRKRLSYHHGDLRAALAAAALEIVRADGAGSLSLRRLAQVTGVSLSAPYAHFSDKTELLAAVAAEGFRALASAMAVAAAGARGNRARVESLAAAYVGFAADNGNVFRLMFGPEFSDMGKFPALAMAAGKSYALIAAALSGRPEREGGVATPFMTVAVWSLCHGLATLVMDGRLDPARLGAETLDAFTRRTVAIFAGEME